MHLHSRVQPRNPEHLSQIEEAIGANVPKEVVSVVNQAAGADQASTGQSVPQYEIPGIRGIHFGNRPILIDSAQQEDAI